jgi:hypothetical protein
MAGRGEPCGAIHGDLPRNLEREGHSHNMRGVFLHVLAVCGRSCPASLV